MATVACIVLALAASLHPVLCRFLELSRGNWMTEPWRLLTGAMVHEVPHVTVLNLLVFGLLGVCLERRSRTLFLAALLASALASALLFLAVAPFDRLVGSSGIACGLLVALLGLAWQERRFRLCLLVAIAFLVKLALDSIGTSPASLAALPTGHGVSLSAHVGGALGGAAAILLFVRCGFQSPYVYGSPSAGPAA